jgi:hypothetical protein
MGGMESLFGSGDEEEDVENFEDMLADMQGQHGGMSKEAEDQQMADWEKFRAEFVSKFQGSVALI